MFLNAGWVGPFGIGLPRLLPEADLGNKNRLILGKTGLFSHPRVRNPFPANPNSSGESSALPVVQITRTNQTFEMRLNSVGSQTLDEAGVRFRAPAHNAPAVAKLTDSISQIASWMTNTLNCVPDALLATNSCGDVLFMNPRAEQLTGWRIEEALRRCSSDVFHLMDESGLRLESPLREAYVEEQVYRCPNCVLAAADGDRTKIEYTAAPIRTEEGEVVGAVVVFREREPEGI